MVNVGYVNKLKIVKETEFGLFLSGDDELEILLPRRYVTEEMKVDDEIEVFVGLDSEDRLLASTDYPYVMVGEIEQLEVVSTETVGAFLNWGLPKDLFLPFIEQTRPLSVGDKVIVACYVDNTGRIAASMRLQRHVSQKKADIKPSEQVSAFVVEKNEIGYKVIVNDTHWGILYDSEVFEKLNIGQHLKAYVTKCRPDGKIDLYMQPLGYKAIPSVEEKILKVLEEDGFLAITDKTPAEKIYDLFQVSKKKFKMALGGLYKKRLISIEEKGIRLLTK